MIFLFISATLFAQTERLATVNNSRDYLSEVSALHLFADSSDYLHTRFIFDRYEEQLHRLWEAERTVAGFTGFTGKKFIKPDLVFKGEAGFTYQNLSSIFGALSEDPYSTPFLLSDEHYGDFLSQIPQLAFSLSRSFRSGFIVGINLSYSIQDAIKNNYSYAERISRETVPEINIAYKVNEKISLGMAGGWSNKNSVIKLSALPDGSIPTVRRYKGEFLFSTVTATDDRTANSNTVYLVNEIVFSAGRLSADLKLRAASGHEEIYDGTAVRHYQGYTDSKYLDSEISCRFSVFPDNRLSTFFYSSISLFNTSAFNYTDNTLFAEHDAVNATIKADLKYFSRQYPAVFSLTTEYSLTGLEKNEYSAGVFRRGNMIYYSVGINSEFLFAKNRKILTGIGYHSFKEDDIWNYWGDYQGATLKAGTVFSKRNKTVTVYGKVIRNYGNDNKKELLFSLNVEFMNYL